MGTSSFLVDQFAPEELSLIARGGSPEDEILYLSWLRRSLRKAPVNCFDTLKPRLNPAFALHNILCAFTI